MKCDYCEEDFEEGAHVIDVIDNDHVVHYDCIDRYLHSRLYTHEAIIQDGRVLHI